MAVNIPPHFYKVKYRASRTPGVPHQADLARGANCQVFAYELLKVNGLCPENQRSSQLWQDKHCSIHVNAYQALDLMLYNTSDSAFGAHLALYLGDGNVIHLSSDIGSPEIISHAALQQRPKYRVFIGAKRIVSTS